MIEGMKETMARVFEVYVQAQPAPFAERARAEFPGPADCYRIKDDDGHYMLVGFEEPEPDTDRGVTAIMVHGKDSTLPGEIVHKVPFTALVICDCGVWETTRFTVADSNGTSNSNKKFM
jgi:hypothetical protein